MDFCLLLQFNLGVATHCKDEQAIRQMFATEQVHEMPVFAGCALVFTGLRLESLHEFIPTLTFRTGNPAAPPSQMALPGHKFRCFSVSYVHYNDCEFYHFDTFPALPMATNRPTLKLDAKSFQDLLAAAFTIQEHNAKVSRNGAGASKPETVVAVKPERVVSITSEPVSAIAQAIQRFCPHCAAPLKEGESHGDECGQGKSRPGERGPRKFTSFCDMSQEQGVGHQREPESVLEVASSGPAYSSAAALDVSRIANTEEEAPLLDSEERDELSEFEGPHLTDEVEIESDSVGSEIAAAGPSERLQGYLRSLNLSNADIYLGLAVLVAALAILWPAPPAVHKAGLQPWQRVLVALGVAEAPAPVVHYRGDPNVQVWVDPHTALYYCAGEEQYGKSANGRFEAQREAQLDQFEPAGRAVCQ